MSDIKFLNNFFEKQPLLQPPERGPLAASPETAPPSCDVVVDGFIIVIYEAIIAWLRVRARAFPRLSETMLLLPMI